jgi:hypothetical protein
MSEAGTLLSDLGNAPPNNDSDLVDSIFADLNQTRGPTQAQQQPGPAARQPMQQVPPMHSTYPNAADPAVPTAHLIGKDHPTEADFQRMMMAAQGPLPFNAMAPQMAAPAPQTAQAAQPPAVVYEEPKKNWTGQWIDELKQPLLVAIVLFIVTLPAVNLLVSHYAPKLLRPGGDFTTMGLLARALVGGALFWVFQRVVGPLVAI